MPAPPPPSSEEHLLGTACQEHFPLHSLHLLPASRSLQGPGSSFHSGPDSAAPREEAQWLAACRPLSLSGRPQTFCTHPELPAAHTCSEPSATHHSKPAVGEGQGGLQQRVPPQHKSPCTYNGWGSKGCPGTSGVSFPFVPIRLRLEGRPFNPRV